MDLRASKIARTWVFVVMAGVAAFAAGIAVYCLVGAGWIVDVLTVESDAVSGAVMATLFALAAMAVAGIVVNVRMRAKYRLTRQALNNMTQGLCMFDSTARLLLCNDRYLEIYRLQPEDGRRGTPLRELLVRRAAAGTFTGDPDRYVAEYTRQVTAGPMLNKSIEIKDGRVISLVGQPMAHGGWVATHTDVTHQLQAERERDSLR